MLGDKEMAVLCVYVFNEFYANALRVDADDFGRNLNDFFSIFMGEGQCYFLANGKRTIRLNVHTATADISTAATHGNIA